MLVGSEVMTAELEMVVDPAVGGEETLRVTRRLEALHLSLSSSCRLMRHLSAIVEIGALAVLDPRQDLAFGGGVALELVCDDHPWNIPQALQQLAEEPHGRGCAAPALDQNVEDISGLVDRAPK